MIFRWSSQRHTVAWALLPAALGLFGLTAARSSAAQNLLSNPGFEEASETAWRADEGASLVRDGSRPRSGAYAAAFSHAGPGARGFFQTVITSAGWAHSLEAYCISDAPETLFLRLEIAFYGTADGTGPALTVASSASLAAGPPEYLRLAAGPVTAPPGSASARAGAITYVAAQATVYCDDFTLLAALQPPVATATATATALPAATATASPTPTPTLSPTATFTVTPTNTPAATATATNTRTATPTATPTASPASAATPTPISFVPTATPLPAGAVVISEVLFNSEHPGRDAAYEWLELLNRLDIPVSTRGWTVADNQETEEMPELLVPAGGYGLVAATAEGLNRISAAAPWAPMPDGSLGNGLNNDGDRLVIRDAGGRVVDGLSWGNDAAVNSPPCPAVQPGHSLDRAYPLPSAECSFWDNPAPSPGWSSPGPAAPPYSVEPVVVHIPIAMKTWPGR